MNDIDKTADTPAQAEFWPFRDKRAVPENEMLDQIGQKEPLHYQERLWEKMDKKQAAWKQKQAQVDRVRELSSPPLTLEQIYLQIQSGARKKKKHVAMEWDDTMPPGTPHFDEAGDEGSSDYEFLPPDDIFVPPEYRGWETVQTL